MACFSYRVFCHWLVVICSWSCHGLSKLLERRHEAFCSPYRNHPTCIQGNFSAVRRNLIVSTHHLSTISTQRPISHHPAPPFTSNQHHEKTCKQPEASYATIRPPAMCSCPNLALTLGLFSSSKQQRRPLSLFRQE